jgi:hypothetical protein
MYSITIVYYGRRSVGRVLYGTKRSCAYVSLIERKYTFWVKNRCGNVAQKSLVG